MVNMTIGGVRTMKVNSLGVSRSAIGFGSTIDGVNLMSDRTTNSIADGALGQYPFNRQSFGVVIEGNAQVIESRTQIGAMTVVGVVERLFANADSRNVKGLFEGIVAPVYVADQLRNVDIGEGIQAAGTATVTTGGIYTGGLLGELRGKNADIRGDILSQAGINRISLDGGSFVGASIAAGAGVYDDFRHNQEFPVAVEGNGTNRSLDNNLITGERRRFGIAEINISNGGGMIGTRVTGSYLGRVKVTNGFGVFDSDIVMDTNGIIEGIDTDGYGIRGTSVRGGTIVYDLIARGDTDQQLPLSGFGSSVQFSGAGQDFDPYSGLPLTGANDLRAYLGVEDDVDTAVGVTDRGVIEDTRISGPRQLQRFQAFRTRSDSTDRPGQQKFPNRLNLADRIDNFNVVDDINGLGITTGRIGEFNVGGRVARMSIQSAGPISRMNFRSDVLSSVGIRATGGGASIGSVTVAGSFLGVLETSNRLGELIVGRNIQSSSIFGLESIGTVRVGRDVLEGSIIRTNGRFDSLFIGRDIRRTAFVRAASFGTKEVVRREDGSIRP
jgi:hypothetical protein